MNLTDVNNRFTYHKPTEDQVPKFEKIRDQVRMAAAVINDLAPESREKSLAITKCEEAVFWANAAIARHGGGD